MSIMELSGLLSKEEVELLSKDPICLNCNHREIFHNKDYKSGTECRVCECTQFIKDWSVETYDSICKPFESTLGKLLESMVLKEFSKEKELYEGTGKVIRLIKHNRLKSPE